VVVIVEVKKESRETEDSLLIEFRKEEIAVSEQKGLT
jgi:hypothetical protein